MKVSEITAENIASYIRLTDATEEEINELTNLLNVAKEFIKSYTGLSAEEIDKHEDFEIVVKVLCQDMYDNRALYVDKTNLNKVVETILGLHSVNLL
jgi:Mn-dependent DtxR family transcriptional regulator